MLCKNTLRNKVIAFLIFCTIIGTLFLVLKNEGKIGETIQKKFTSIQSQGYLAEGENEGESEENKENEEAKVYSINMLVNELNKAEGVSVSGTKIKIEVPEGLTFGVYNVQTDEEILPDEDEKYEVPEDGAKFKIDGVEEKVYDIILVQAETAEEYTSTFQSATIEIDAQNGELKTFVKEIVKNIKGQEEIIAGSEENTAIFAYEDEENHNVKIKDNEDTVIYYYIGSAKEELSEEELNEVEWQIYNKENGLEINKNCIVYSKSKYKTGEYSEISKDYVTNIDKVAPKIEIETKTEKEDIETSIRVTIEDEETDEYGASGIVAYAITEKTKYEDETEDENVTEGENATEGENVTEGENATEGENVTEGENATEGENVTEGENTTEDENINKEENELEEEEPQYIECEKTTKLEKEIGGITKNGTYYLWAKDAIGNVSKKEFEITNINTAAIILSSPYEELNGTEYESLNNLVTALKTANSEILENTENTGNVENSENTENSLEENSTLEDSSIQNVSLLQKVIAMSTENKKVIIQMVHNIENESVVLDDENEEIVLDLNGYTIASSNESEATITVESGNLQVVDNKYKISDYIEDEEKSAYLEEQYSANTDQNGKIYNSNYTAIEVKEGAVLTIGEDDKTVSIVSPVIEGKEKGILNEGELNYYDGIIIGKSTIDGDITLTPAAYDPTTSETEEEGILQTYLVKASGVEALIGRTRYEKIENAVAVANNEVGTEEDQVEIDVVTDIVIDEDRGTTDETGAIIAAGSLLIDEDKNIKLDLNGYSITNTTSDYVIKNSGKLEIIDSSVDETEETTVVGKIFSTTSSAIYNDETGILTIGEKDGEVNTESPNISGNDYGIYNNQGTINFYDGIIEGKEGQSIYGNPSNIEEDCYIKKYKNGGSEEYEVESGKEIVILKPYEIAMVKSTGKIYSSLAKALPNTINEDTITLLYSTTIKEDKESLEIPSEKDITLDLAGYTITAYNENTFVNNGNLTITDSCESKSGRIGALKDVFVKNNEEGTLEIESGILVMQGYSTNDKSFIVNYGKFKMIDGQIGASGYLGAICNRGKGIIEVIGGTINGIYNDDTGIVKVTGGTITGINYGINNNGTGTIEVTGGTITTSSYGIYNNSTGTIEVTGGTIKCTYASSDYPGIYNAGLGKIEVTGGTVASSGYYGIYNEGAGTIEVTGGTITGSWYGLFNDSTGMLKISGGTISGGTSGIYNHNTGIVEVTDGNISGDDDGIYNIGTGTVKIIGGIITSNKYGIYNNETGTVEVTGGTITGSIYGIFDNSTGIVEVTDGTITGDKYGIYNIRKGTINVTGGTITGDTGGIYNEVGTVEITGGSITTSNDSSSSTYGIYNEDSGIIKITEGTIAGYYGIYNKSTGTVEVAGGTITASLYGILNETGTITITEGTITGSYGIYNKGTGTVEVAGGTITASLYGILNETGTITITEGTITVTGVRNI
jgi:hypothetical protein